MKKSNNNIIKPQLNSSIYIVFNQGRVTFIYKETVIAKGDEIFFHSGALDACNVEDYKRPLRYDDHNTWWFKSLKEVKAKYPKVKFKKITECWEVVEDDD